MIVRQMKEHEECIPKTTIQTKYWNSVCKTVWEMNNWSRFLITSLKVTFLSHVPAAWSCANSQVKHEYLPSVTVVTVSCSANRVSYLMLSAKHLKSSSPIIFCLLSCYPANCFRSNLCILFLQGGHLLALWKKKTFKTISILLLTLDYYSCFPTQPVPSTSYSTQSFQCNITL